jgi:GntR family transcriptional regulator
MTTTRSVRRRPPMSEQIANDMIDLIRHGDWSELDKLPPEQELTDLFKASRVTIRQALKALEARGLVAARQGKGTYVVRTPGMVHAGLQELKSITMSIREMGFEPSMEYAQKLTRSGTPSELHDFDLSPDAEVLELRRKIFADGTIVAFVEDVMPLWVFGPTFRPQQLDGSVFAHLREHTDVVPHTAVAHVHARATLTTSWQATIASPSDLPQGPFILLDQLQFDTRGRPFMHTKAHFVEGVYEFVVLRIA